MSDLIGWFLDYASAAQATHLLFRGSTMVSLASYSEGMELFGVVQADG